MGLAALSRTFCGRSFDRRLSRALGNRPTSNAVEPVSFWPPRRPKAAKTKQIFAKRNERFRNAGCNSLKSLGAPNHHFAELFVFNHLTVISFRAFSKSALPTQKGLSPANPHQPRPAFTPRSTGARRRRSATTTTSRATSIRPKRHLERRSGVRISANKRQ